MLANLLEHSVDEFLNDTSTINSLFLHALLIEKHYFILFAKITSHAGFKSVHELAASSNCYDQLRIYLVLEKQCTIIVFFICFDELLEPGHSGLERENEGKFFEKHFYASGSFPE